MAINTIEPEIIFPPGFDARWEAEMTDKGYISNVIIRFEDGSRYRVNFIDPVRLGQDLESEAESGSLYLAEPGMIVVPSVTKELIQKAVDGLVTQGFFDTQKPLNRDVAVSVAEDVGFSTTRLPHPGDLIQKAERQLRSAREMSPESARSNVQKAVTILDEAIELARTLEKSASIFSGCSEERLGNYDRALNKFNRALEIDPIDDVALVHRGLLRYNESTYDLALKDFEKAVSLGTDFVWPYYYLAHDSFEKGRRSEGIELSERALTLADRIDVTTDLRNWIERAHFALPFQREHFHVSITLESALREMQAA